MPIFSCHQVALEGEETSGGEWVIDVNIGVARTLAPEGALGEEVQERVRNDEMAALQ